MTTLEKLWRDESGGINSSELIFLCTILIIGVIPGIAALRNAIVCELDDLAHAVSAGDFVPPGLGDDDDFPPGRGRGRGRGRGLGLNNQAPPRFQRIVVCADAIPES